MSQTPLIYVGSRVFRVMYPEVEFHKKAIDPEDECADFDKIRTKSVGSEDRPLAEYLVRTMAQVPQVFGAQVVAQNTCLSGVPIQFHVPNRMMLDKTGTPVVPGGVMTYYDPELEELLGVEPGRAKFAVMTGRFWESVCDPLPLHFRVLAPEDATHLLLFHVWAPDQNPTLTEKGCEVMTRMTEYSVYNQPSVIAKTQVLSHGCSIRVMDRAMYPEWMEKRMLELQRKLELRVGEAESRVTPTEIRGRIKHLEPLLRRVPVHLAYREDFCEMSRANRKWFMPYTEMAFQELMDTLYAAGFHSVLGRRFPIGVTTSRGGLSQIIEDVTFVKYR